MTKHVKCNIYSDASATEYSGFSPPPNNRTYPPTPKKIPNFALLIDGRSLEMPVLLGNTAMMSLECTHVSRAVLSNARFLCDNGASCLFSVLSESVVTVTTETGRGRSAATQRPKSEPRHGTSIVPKRPRLSTTFCCE